MQELNREKGKQVPGTSFLTLYRRARMICLYARPFTLDLKDTGMRISWVTVGKWGKAEEDLGTKVYLAQSASQVHS